MKSKGIVIYVLAVLFLAYEMALQVSPSVMTEELMHDFGIGASALGVMASFYFYSYTLMQIPSGMLFDVFSPRLLISFSIVLCSVGALFFGTTTNVELASVGRFFMGIGSAFAFIGVLVVSSQWFKRKYFALLVGIAQLLAALGALGGELPLAHLVNDFGWREVINVIALSGLLLAALTLLFVKRHPHHKEKKHTSSKQFLKDLRQIFKNGQTWWIALYAFSGWAPVTVFAALWGVPFLMHKYNVANTHAASATAMVWLGIGLTAPIIGYVSDLIKRRMVLISTCAAVGLMSSLVLLYADNLSFYYNYLFLFLMGFASSGQILSFALVSDINKPKVVGTAIGLNNMAVVIGGALFQPLVGAILGMTWAGEIRNGVPIYGMGSYQLSLFVVPLCYAIGLFVSLFFIKETYCKATYES